MGMLLRRLKTRLREGGRTGPFRCIATSATIAGGERDKAAVAKFASELFAERFLEEDVILGKPEPIIDFGIKKDLSLKDYSVLQQALNMSSKHDLPDVARRLGKVVPEGLNVTKEIGFILQHDRRSTKIRQLITAEPREVHVLANDIFPNLLKVERVPALSELIGLLVRAEDSSGIRLLSTRYHFFLRSLEGAFVSYFPQKQILLERRSQAEKVAIFEIALCRECGQHYIVGRFKDGKLKEAIRDPGHPDFGATFFRPIEEDVSDIDEEKYNMTKKKIFRLCIECGAMVQINRRQSELVCGHTKSVFVEQQEGAEEREDQIPKCSACEYRAPDPVREVVHGTDGPHAVIATALYQRLPKERRKILAFADGRQQAAFFAWYLENSYRDILNRNLIFKIARSFSKYPVDGISLYTIADRAFHNCRDSFKEKESDDEPKIHKNIWRALYREFLTDEQRISLEGVGLLRWHIKWPEKFKIPDILFSTPWCLNKQEAKDLIFILLDFMRTDRAVELQTASDVSLTWSDLNLQASQMRVRIGPPRRPKGRKYWPVRSWDGKTGKRAQFLIKLLIKKGLSKQDAVEKTFETLRAIWESFRQSGESTPSQHRFLLSIDDARRLNPDWWRVFPISDNDVLYQCDTCARLQSIYVSGVCTRHRCPGSVQEIRAKELEASHYRLLYEDNLPGVLRVEEHTAQIDKEEAREFQREFKAGKIHVLSSSTTFELGVDLGDLDIIFLRNVPPEAFNYAQRVGRAGRTSGFPGFAITFCRRNPHDLYHFAEPNNRIIKGTIKPPVISLRNKKIITRHISALTLSYFFRDFPDRFLNVEKLFGDLEHPFGVSNLVDFLQRRKIKLEDSLRSIIPPAMMSEVGINDGTWIQYIVGEDSRFALAEVELSSDFRAVKKLQKDSAIREDYPTAGWAKRRAQTISGEDILSFFSRKTIIPKYGFPVDVVELDTHKIQQKSESFKVLLQRDLSIAIAEFAPTSKLVANKKEWISYGIKKVAGKEWEVWHYCLKHYKFIKKEKKEQILSEVCCEGLKNHKFIIPKFGFVTDRNKPTNPKGRTPRVFTTRPYFVGLTVSEAVELDFGAIKVTKASPGWMVVLCEGRKGEGFYICPQCGAGFRECKNQHKTPYGENCCGSLEQVSLGHEFITDVLQIQFLLRLLQNDIDGVWFAYSLAYALIEGVSEVLEVPSTDLSTTVAYNKENIIPPIILYDNVPGGAGLVARLEEKEKLRACLEAALERVSGDCGCGEDDSCYGCLRSYRNQFAHQHLRRGPVMHYLKTLLEEWK
jgi:hypothetical protein